MLIKNPHIFFQTLQLSLKKHAKPESDIRNIFDIDGTGAPPTRTAVTLDCSEHVVMVTAGRYATEPSRAARDI